MALRDLESGLSFSCLCIIVGYSDLKKFRSGIWVPVSKSVECLMRISREYLVANM